MLNIANNKMHRMSKFSNCHLSHIFPNKVVEISISSSGWTFFFLAILFGIPSKVCHPNFIFLHP